MTKVRKQAGSVELEHDQVFLMAEDNPNDAELFSEMLNEAFHGQYSVVCVDRFSKIAEALETGKFEALILDMDLPDKSGIDNISHLGEQYPTLPIVVLTGHEDAELAIDSLQCGAQDYLSKNNVTPDVLARSVKYANERKQIERKLKDALQDAAYKNIQLEAQAKHDALTGLANRTYFQESANRVLARAERKNKIVGLLFFDLNEFKKINDTYGHATGDELLKQVSERIGQVIRESDFVARIGGDEFVVITDLMEDKHDIYPLVKRIQNQFDLLFRVGSHDLECTTSIGIAFYPDAPNLDMLMKQADCAMYEAKANIGAHVCFYSEKLDSLYTRSQTIESNLGSAIEKKELIAQFQPVVSASGEHKVYLEALARWHSASLGEVSPDEFIPIAESSPAINGVTQAVTRRVNDLLTVVNDYGLNIDRISINVSAQQLGSQHFCRLFLQWLSELNLPPEYICLELTERHRLRICLIYLSIF